jgi:hypothetical protein
MKPLLTVFTALIFMNLLTNVNTVTANSPNDKTSEHDKDSLIRIDCIGTLQIVKEITDHWLLKHAETLGTFDEGVIDEGSLTLIFLPSTAVNSKEPRFSIKIQFRHPYTLPDEDEHKGYWYFLGLAYDWSWEGKGEFPLELQKSFTHLIESNFQTITEFESATAKTILEKYNNKSFSLAGNNNMKLLIDSIYTKEDENYYISFSEYNKTVNSLALYPGNIEIIINDIPILNFNHIYTKYVTNKNPFQYLIPLSSAAIKSYRLGKLQPGIYQITGVICHRKDTWTDYRPTYTSGKAIMHTEKNSWIGIAVSDMVTVEIFPDGTVEYVN